MTQSDGNLPGKEVAADDGVAAPGSDIPEQLPRDGEARVTVCPACATAFRVTGAQLRVARGRVRCGHCANVFDGVAHLEPEETSAFASTQDALAALDALVGEMYPGERSATDSRCGLDTAGQGVAGAAASVAAGGPAPVDFARQRRWRRMRWVLVLVGLLVIAGEVLWLQFDRLAVDPFWRPVCAKICEVTGCRLPMARALDLIETRSLVVEAAPSVMAEPVAADDGLAAGELAMPAAAAAAPGPRVAPPANLTVRIVLVNGARFTQPFPELELNLSGLSGPTVVSHRFAPWEYLAGAAADLALMPPDIPVQIELTVPDPGGHVVNYELRLR